MEGYSYTEAERIIKKFEGLLRESGINIRKGSALEALTLNAYEIAYGRKESAREYSNDLRAMFRELVGLTELAALILTVANHHDFPQLLPHLRLLNEGIPAQNLRAPGSDDAANKLFELMIACLAMHCGVDVILDHPRTSRGDNPDVLGTIRGLRWGFACKVLQSTSPQSIIDNVDRGKSQIDKSAAQRGLVVINTKNVIKPESYWGIANVEAWKQGSEPEYNCFPNDDVPLNLLQRELDSLGTMLIAHAGGHQVLLDLFKGSKAFPGFLLWAHVVAGVIRNGLPVPGSLRLFTLQHLIPFDQEIKAVCECLNRRATDTSLWDI